MTITTEALVLNSPAQLVAGIPQLLGFTPDDSLIAVWLIDGSLLVTQRVDLDPALSSPSEFFGAIERGPASPDEVILVVWQQGERTFDDRIADLVAHAEERWDVRDVLWVADQRWGSLVCMDPECCPVAGRPIDLSLFPDLGNGTPASHRETLLVECKPEGTERMKPLDPHGIEGWRDKSIERIIAAYAEGGFESPKHLTRAGRALHDIRVRDVILWHAALDLSPEECREAYGLASAVARAMHPDDAAPACTVAACLAWLAGDGARANIALDYAAASDRGYSLMHLLQQSVSSALPPSSWVDAMSGLSYDEVRKPVKS